jgi:hypothetical protein
MPVVVFQQTTNKYTDTQIEANEQLRSVSFAISAPYSALYQVAKKVSSNGEPVWDSTEIPAQPGQGGFADKIYGIHFKSFDPTHPTTILCKAFFEDDPIPTGDLASTSTFNTTGQVNPGGASVQVQKDGVLVGTEPILDFEDAGANVWSAVDDIAGTRIKISPPKILTGQVSGAGGIVSGNGFTVTRTGTGRYTINFNVAFALAPAFIVSCGAFDGNEDITWGGALPGSCQVNIQDAGLAVDRGFMFIAIAMG